MLRELVEASVRFSVAPAGYKRRRLDRVIEILQDDRVEIREPSGDGFREVEAPDRQRSGKTTRQNVKPFLLVDDAEYVLGVGGPEARIKHGAYRKLVRDAARATGDRDLWRFLRVLKKRKIKGLKVDPKETLGVRCYPASEFAIERAAVKKYWAGYLEQEHCVEGARPCLCCGEHKRPVRILPNEVVILGQKCQMLSFKEGAYHSFGKNQTENATVCFGCATAAIQSLRFLCEWPLHRATVATDATKGRKNPLRNQLAVFWTRRAQEVEAPGGVFDLEALLGVVLSKPEETGGLPAPELAQLEALVRVPWAPREEALLLEPNSFYLAILSANKARLVVRDWITLSVEEVRRQLAEYLDGIRIIDPQGQRKLVLPIPLVLRAMRSANPSLSRGLLRTAYQGNRPRPALLQAAVRRLRIPETWKENSRRKRRDASEGWMLPALAAAVKLVLTHRTREAKEFVELNEGSGAPAAYQCGRLLAIGEEAQRRASRGKVSATVVDRLYGTASVSPALVLPMLVRRIETAYLPKIRKTGRGHRELQEGLEEVAQGIERGGGFQAVLKIEEQGWFALGFYHQRAEFRKPRTEQPAANNETGEKK